MDVDAAAGLTRDLAVVTPLRPLGARGSRSVVGAADPAAELTPTAAAVIAAIPAWWSTRAAEAGLDGDWLDVHEAIAGTPPPVSLSECPPLQQEWGPLSAEQVGAAYVSSLTKGTRARHGRHYTPPALASQLWEMARAALGHRHYGLALPGLVRDPACGAGALLLPALREHLATTWSQDPDLVLARLPNLVEGIDTDPAAVWVANVVLAAEMLPTLARVPASRRRPLPALARVGDGLAEPADPARLVLMNPPYGRVQLDATDRERFAHVLYGHANLYGIFMAAGQQQLDEHGVLAALVPTSFTAGRYFEPLRRLLSSGTRLEALRFVEDRSGVFGSVLQETCLSVFTRRKVRRTDVSSVGSQARPVARVASPTGGRPWILPRRADLAPVAAAAIALPLRLGDVGWRVSTGPLVWNRRRADLHARPGKDRAPVIWAADIDGGVLHRDRARAATRYLRLRDDNDRATMLLRSAAVLVQRTTAPEQRRRLVAAELTAEQLAGLGRAVVVENHVNVLRPAPLPAGLPAGRRAISPGLLTRLLATTTLDDLTRCVSGSVALSAYELEALALPDHETLAAWESLTPDELEAAVRRVYRASAQEPDRR